MRHYFIYTTLVLIIVVVVIYFTVSRKDDIGLSVEDNSVHIEGLPPDPGDEGKKTLEGIDSDGDGVRDDIQRYIALTYPDSERTRAALTQITKATQASLSEADNKDAANARTIEVFRGIECLYAIRPNDARIISDALRAGILNTIDRTKAWLKGDQHFGGESYSLSAEGEETSRCDFDFYSMEN